jgi:hypothetical protein
MANQTSNRQPSKRTDNNNEAKPANDKQTSQQPTKQLTNQQTNDRQTEQ